MQHEYKEHYIVFVRIIISIGEFTKVLKLVAPTKILRRNIMGNSFLGFSSYLKFYGISKFTSNEKPTRYKQQIHYLCFMLCCLWQWTALGNFIHILQLLHWCSIFYDKTSQYRCNYFHCQKGWHMVVNQSTVLMSLVLTDVSEATL